MASMNIHARAAQAINFNVREAVDYRGDTYVTLAITTDSYGYTTDGDLVADSNEVTLFLSPAGLASLLKQITEYIEDAEAESEVVAEALANL